MDTAGSAPGIALFVLTNDLEKRRILILHSSHGMVMLHHGALLQRAVASGTG